MILEKKSVRQTQENSRGEDQAEDYETGAAATGPERLGWRRIGGCRNFRDSRIDGHGDAGGRRIVNPDAFIPSRPRSGLPPEQSAKLITETPPGRCVTKERIQSACDHFLTCAVASGRET